MGGASGRRAWRPLVVGRERQRVLAVVDELSALPVPVGDSSLASGLGGRAVFLAYLAAARGSQAEAREAVRLAEEMMAAAVESDAPTSAGLYEGLCGASWVLAHLDGWLLDVSDDDPNDAVDQALLDLLARPWVDDYDLVSGLVGMGVYAVERLPRPGAVRLLGRIVDQLAETAEYSADGVTWFTPPRLLPEHQRQEAPAGYYNLGVAHGVPGVIALLAQSTAAGVAVAKAARLLNGAVDWLLAHQLHGGGFAHWVGPGIEAYPARSAWCYGDPGVAATLLVGRGHPGRPHPVTAQATAIAAAAARRPAEQAGVVDAGICHGAAGLAHIFNRMWQASGASGFARAARFWLQRTLDLLPETTDAGLLTGRAGIGLVLLASLGMEPAWDRILLLSTPSVRQG